ncbi:methyl-accepting chemotaxis protein [Rubellimicrobium rubrum]|nr:methyl-accepting chemotaxis protein [Rubellimicrobium rubrum]
MTTVHEDAALTSGTGMARMVVLGLAVFPPGAAFLASGPMLPVLLASLMMVMLAFVSRSLKPGFQPLLLAVALIGQCIAFTAALTGHGMQLDSHMLFFAVLAIVSTMGSIPAVVLAVVVTALHHLLLALVLPELVYPSNGLTEDIGRTALHGGIVVFEAAVLIWSMVQSAKARIAVSASRAELAQQVEEAAAARAEADAARERVMAASERTRGESQKAAAAVEEIAANAKAVAESAAHARDAVARANSDAERSSEVVHRATSAMTAIEGSSAQIGQIVAVIDEIARQTDLLALNAAVESARAGEAGRGFAVVAGEVRKLAQRSADATKEIRGLVKTSSEQVRQGTSLVGDTGQALDRIVAAVSDLNGLMNTIAAGAAEQAIGLDQVNAAIVHIDHIAQGGETGAVVAAQPAMATWSKKSVARDRTWRAA